MKTKNIQLVRLYESGIFKGFSLAVDEELIDEVVESSIKTTPEGPLEMTVKFALCGQDVIGDSIRIDIEPNAVTY
ncbi:hypothetical protein [Rahnella sp. ChDrAdgB13]|uniref:hypothetical protein n=1 Tax=Rahnella sp. ChDrAdgB13 TaxID=1850581 RepID=UPI001AD86E9E|nr:hypothetical protein [Rahnella sp. ChDrAdgB13]